MSHLIFNDNSTLYNFESGEFAICDIDFYAKQCYINGHGKALGDTNLMSPGGISELAV